ncbi:MAG TPA: hypothetical protein ENI57_00640 [Ignavibacteria bacterium]|nr:hypothetical protein [Ignavibacteria bacterium]
MKKYSFLIFLIIYSNLFAQADHKSILYLKSESKQLIKTEQFFSDSVYSNKKLNNKYSVGSLIAQGLTGSISGLGLGFLAIGSAFAYSWRHGATTFSRVGFTLLVPASMIFGSAIGVHLIAKYENPKHSFWQTVKYSAYGAGGGVILSLILASLHTKTNTGEVVLISLSPVIGSLIYSNYVTEWPETNQKDKISKITFRKLNYSFKDYYESTQLFRINILSIAF